MFSNKFNILYNNLVINYIMDTKQLQDRLDELNEENTNLKLRITELENKLQYYIKQKETKIIYSQIPKHIREPYSYWI
jgi:regulator of replication initiation timing